MWSNNYPQHPAITLVLAPKHNTQHTFRHHLQRGKMVGSQENLSGISHQKPNTTIPQKTLTSMAETERDIFWSAELDRRRSQAAFSHYPRTSDLPQSEIQHIRAGIHLGGDSTLSAMWSGQTHYKTPSSMLTYSRGTQEEWKIPISNRYAVRKLALSSSQIQNGGVGNTIENISRRRLDFHR